jgi:hypothetical protein
VALEHLAELCKPEHSRQCLVYDNTDFAAPRVIHSRVNQFADLERELAIHKVPHAEPPIPTSPITRRARHHLGAVDTR